VLAAESMKKIFGAELKSHHVIWYTIFRMF